MTAVATPAQAASLFSNIAIALASKQGELRGYENRSVYPSRDFAAAFDGLAHQYDDARMAYFQTRPADVDFVSQLGNHVRNIAHSAGQMEQMAKSETTFGGGWANSLQPAINDAQRAIQLLTSAPVVPAPPVPAPAA